MGKSGGAGGKKAAGNAKKAENAAVKAAAEQAKADAVEDAKWQQGSKSTKKSEDAAAKRAEADRKKAEKAALMAAEDAATPSKPKNSKSATKKTSAKPAAPLRKLDLAQLDDDGPGSSSMASPTLNASGIDNALDALALTGSSNNDKIEKHPERRFKAAYAVFEARRLPEIEEENPGLRRNQRIELARKEFEKHPDNPFNQVSVKYDATREDIAEMKASERKKVEDRLGA